MSIVSPAGGAMVRSAGAYKTTHSDGSESYPAVGSNLGRFVIVPNVSASFINASGDRTEFRDVIEKIIYADGEVWTYYYNQIPNYNNPYNFPHLNIVKRLKFVSSSKGYGLQFSYTVESIPDTASSQYVAWSTLSRVTFYNESQVVCAESALVDCTSVLALPTYVSFSSDTANRTATISPPNEAPLLLSFAPGGDILSRSRVGISGSTITYGYVRDTATTPDGEQYDRHELRTVTKGGSVWTYQPNYPVSAQEANDPWATSWTLATDPANRTYSAAGALRSGELVGHTNGAGESWSAVPDLTYFWIKQTIEPEGGGLEITRDALGRVVKVERRPKTGISLAILPVNEATYLQNCTDWKLCFKPTSIKDAKSNTTSYTYSSDHGGVLTETGPAVAGMTPSGWVASGIQPVKRYSYVQRYAWVKNSSGAYVQESSPVWLLSEERFCKTGATLANNTGCVLGASDEVVTAYDYGPNSGPNNLFLRGVAVTADGVTQRTCYGYDVNGRKIYETKPRAGLASCN